MDLLGGFLAIQVPGHSSLLADTRFWFSREFFCLFNILPIRMQIIWWPHTDKYNEYLHLHLVPFSSLSHQHTKFWLTYLLWSLFPLKLFKFLPMTIEMPSLPLRLRKSHALTYRLSILILLLVITWAACSQRRSDLCLFLAIHFSVACKLSSI